MKKTIIHFSLVVMFGIGPSVWAADKKAAAPAGSPDNPSVLNFESDVIEGQKKAPDLFLQTDIHKPSLDSILYQRMNFNDFHSSDSKRRPRLSDPPVAGSKHK
jgi:hypothetical protein